MPSEYFDCCRCFVASSPGQKRNSHLTIRNSHRPWPRSSTRSPCARCACRGSWSGLGRNSIDCKCTSTSETEQKRVPVDLDNRDCVLRISGRVEHLRNAKLVGREIEVGVTRKHRGEPGVRTPDVEHRCRGKHVRPGRNVVLIGSL